MKKALALLVIVSSFLVIGCSGSEESTGGNLPGADANAASNTSNPKAAGTAVTTPMAAPPGVKTGTPGG